ncbi:MAG: RlmE family RNA methyltransferase [Candidatus Verstraetearchaeota archaeon]|jgi:23S rRNA (uridine2552-2'-O)-methyltransferase|nr:RlmE family RNA methyltransferase [Candidatus Verstraetearchaeota archaeon]
MIKCIRDSYYKEAKRRGLRSRAAFKLLEISRKFSIIKKGDIVLDLGAAPGGWLQIARMLTGENGKVIGVDISPIKPLPYSNVFIIRKDVRDPSLIDDIRKISGGEVDVILSDLAPKFSGFHHLDHFRQISLVKYTISIANSLLKKHGNMVIKIIMGSEVNKLIKEISNNFNYVKLYKPKASRKHSSEIYLICKEWKEKS